MLLGAHAVLALLIDAKFPKSLITISFEAWIWPSWAEAQLIMTYPLCLRWAGLLPSRLALPMPTSPVQANHVP